jgi:transcriptional regulator with XRE-family HTH domain
MEQETVNERLNYLVNYFEFGKKAAFARKAGISPQGAQELLAGRKGDPSFKVLVKILEAYPQVYADWLVLGRGPMLQEEVQAAAHLAMPAPAPTEAWATREEYEQTRQMLANLEHIMDSLIDMSPPEVAARIRQSAADELANKQQKK